MRILTALAKRRIIGEPYQAFSGRETRIVAPAIFDLTENPFHLLNLSLRADRSEIADAYEDALADGRADEPTLQRARQAVLNPRSRLESELTWLPGISHSSAMQIMRRMERGDGAAQSLDGLAKANLTAHLCCRRSVRNRESARELIQSYNGFSAVSVLVLMEGLRKESGFPAVDERQIADALANLKRLHAKAAVACVVQSTDPGAAMTKIVKDYMDAQDSNIRSVFNLIVREYDAWTEPRLAEIKEKIEESAERCKPGGGSAPVARIVGLLAEWDAVSQPVQLSDQSKGIEEPRSREICRIVHNLAGTLLSEQDRIADALKLSQALLNTFPELPETANRISEDIEAIKSLEPIAAMKAVDDLIKAADKFKREAEGWASYRTMTEGFGPASTGNAKSLYNVFARAVEKTADTSLAETPWGIIRNLLVDLHKGEVLGSGAAITVLRALLEHKIPPPPRIKAKLRQDLRHLERAGMWEKLKSSKDPHQKLELTRKLLDGASAQERQTLLQIQARLDASVEKRYGNVGWIMAAFLIGIFIIGFAAESCNSSDTNYTRTSTRRTTPTTTSRPPTSTSQPRTNQPVSTNRLTTPSSGTSSAARGADRTTAPPIRPTRSAFIETKPPFGSNRLFTENEVRYAVYQSKRIDFLKSMLEDMSSRMVEPTPYLSSEDVIDRYNAQVNRYNNSRGKFNALVQDYNSRCSSFRYTQGVLQRIEAEAEHPEIGVKLRKEAQDIFNSWQTQP